MNVLFLFVQPSANLPHGYPSRNSGRKKGGRDETIKLSSPLKKQLFLSLFLSLSFVHRVHHVRSTRKGLMCAYARLPCDDSGRCLDHPRQIVSGREAFFIARVAIGRIKKILLQNKNLDVSKMSFRPTRHLPSFGRRLFSAFRSAK